MPVRNNTPADGNRPLIVCAPDDRTRKFLTDGRGGCGGACYDQLVILGPKRVLGHRPLTASIFDGLESSDSEWMVAHLAVTDVRPHCINLKRTTFGSSLGPI